MKNLDLKNIQEKNENNNKLTISTTLENRFRENIMDNSTDSIRSTLREKDFFRKESEKIVNFIRQCKKYNFNLTALLIKIYINKSENTQFIKRNYL